MSSENYDDQMKSILGTKWKDLAGDYSESVSDAAEQCHVLTLSKQGSIATETIETVLAFSEKRNLLAECFNQVKTAFQWTGEFSQLNILVMLTNDLEWVRAELELNSFGVMKIADQELAVGDPRVIVEASRSKISGESTSWDVNISTSARIGFENGFSVSLEMSLPSTEFTSALEVPENGAMANSLMSEVLPKFPGSKSDAQDGGGASEVSFMARASGNFRENRYQLGFTQQQPIHIPILNTNLNNFVAEMSKSPSGVIASVEGRAEIGAVSVTASAVLAYGGGWTFFLGAENLNIEELNGLLDDLKLPRIPAELNLPSIKKISLRIGSGSEIEATVETVIPLSQHASGPQLSLVCELSKSNDHWNVNGSAKMWFEINMKEFLASGEFTGLHGGSVALRLDSGEEPFSFSELISADPDINSKDIPLGFGKVDDLSFVYQFKERNIGIRASNPHLELALISVATGASDTLP